MEGLTKGRRRPPRIVLYGPPGIGKSTFGADAPKPVFVTTEDGVDNLPVAQFPKAESWNELLGRVKQVATEEHEFQTIVLDTLNGAFELACQHVCATLYGGQWVAQKGHGGFMGFYQGYKATSEEIRTLLAPLDACRARGMTVILLAHAGLQNVKHPVDGEYNKFAPDVDKNTWARVSGWSDLVLRADFEYSVIKDKGKSKGRAIGTQTRKLFSQGSAAEDAKCRCGYELPDELELSWATVEANLGRGSATLEEVTELWPILTKAEGVKALAWLGIATAKDLPEAQVGKMKQLLNRLRQKQAEKVAASATKEQEVA